MELDVDELRRRMAERGFSQTELARRADLSRARVTAILSDECPEVRPATERKLAGALGLGVGKLVRNAVENEYRTVVVAAQEHLDFTGLGIIHAGDKMPLDRGFAPLMVRERLEDTGCGRRARKIGRRDRKPHRYPLAEAVGRFQRFFLLGNPGAGKTTSLRYLARRWARPGKQSAFCGPLVPVMVRLAEWGAQLQADEEVDVIDAALAHLQLRDARATRSWLRQQADAGKLVLLLDGLDEVADPGHQIPLLEKISAFLREHPDVHVIITARTVGFETPNLGVHFGQVSVESLDTAAIRKFATEWCTFRHGHVSSRKCRDCEQTLKELRHAIIDHPRVRELAANPLMLTILLLLQEAGGTLPQRRCQLYEKMAEALLFSWQERKRASASGEIDRLLKLDDREILWLLESIALEMQKRDWTLAPRWWLAEQIRSFLCDELHLGYEQARQETDALIWTLHRRAGLLVERGPDRFGFLHLAFQEYFAARALLATENPIELIERFLYHPRWREVVRLLSAQLDGRRAPQLLRTVLNDPDPTGRFLHRGLLLVLQCLSDGAPVHDAGLLEEIANEVADLGKSHWLGLGLDVLESLGELRSSRLEEFSVAAVQRMLDKARDALPKGAFLLLQVRAVADRLIHRESGEFEEREDVGDKPILEVPLGDEEGSILIRKHVDRFDAKWAKRVLDQLRTDSSGQVRAACAEVLGRFSTSHAKVRRGLLGAFDHEQDGWVREAIVRAVSAAVGGNRSVRERLLHALDSDPAPNVRAACAEELSAPARTRADIRDKLVALLDRQTDSEVRAGAVGGLAQCAAQGDDLRDRLLRMLNDPDEDDDVRVACLRAIEGLLPVMPEAISSLVDLVRQADSRKLVRVTAQVLARCAATGSLDWSALPIERIEHVLVAIQDPCACALDALRALVDAREVRRQGIPLEARIRRALSGVLDRAKTIFVFGSTARRNQRSDSDLDLLVLGDLTLKELAPSLRRIEQELGRQVNAVVYSEADWAQRYHDRNPFVMQVLKGEKVFVTGGQDELAAMA